MYAAAIVSYGSPRLARSTPCELTPEQREDWVAVMKPVWDQFSDQIGQDNIDAALEANTLTN